MPEQLASERHENISKQEPDITEGGVLAGVVSLAWKWQRRFLGGVPPEQSRSESGNWDWEIERALNP